MKKLSFLLIIIFVYGCSKKSDISINNNLSLQDSTYKSLLLGKWNGVSTSVTFIDSATNKDSTVQNPQTSVGGLFYYTFSSNTVRKQISVPDHSGGSSSLFSWYGNSAYTITNTENKTFINITPENGDPVENWQIITLTSNSLILHRSFPFVEQWSIVNNKKIGYSGYNAVFDEEYTK